MRGKFQVLLGPCSFSVQTFCMRNCLYLFLSMVETMIMKWKERSKIRTAQIDNLRGLLGIRKMNKVLNAWIREQCEVMKRVSKEVKK